ncbi:MAG: ABC transporter permease [Minisyncoccota bacterium]
MTINWIGLKTLIVREITRFMKVVVQTLVTPWISALLYILIFGAIVGKNIANISGVRYIDFVLPGILAMSVISAAFAHSSSSLYIQRFMHNIEELLVTPISHTEMILSYVIGAVVRGVLVGVGILLIAVFFGAAHFSHMIVFLSYLVGVSALFGLLGVLVGLWANSFEQLTVLNTFVIMPLSFVGGVFNSISMLPASWQVVAKANPFFYFVDGIRYSMIGVHEGSMIVGGLMMISLIIASWVISKLLFDRGWNIRS